MRRIELLFPKIIISSGIKLCTYRKINVSYVQSITREQKMYKLSDCDVEVSGEDKNHSIKVHN